MNIQDFGAIGEMIGGIAVIATLLYLSVQVRQANVSTHRNMYAQAATAVSTFWLELAKDDDLYATYVAMLRQDEELSAKDLDRAHLVMDSYLSLMESYYLHNQEYGEQLSQDRWGRVLARVLGTPGGKDYWNVRRSYFHTEFAEYLDGFVE